MTFLQPWWWLLALLALPLLLLRNDRRPRQTVPSLFLWREIGATAPAPRLRPSRPKLDTRSLLLLAALLALIVALAGPRRSLDVADHAVFVLDLSASMSATSGGQTRLEQVLADLRRSLSALDPWSRGGAKVTFVTVDERVNVVSARHSDSREALAALARLEASASPDSASWPEVAETLSGLIRGAERTHLVVFTDGAGEVAARDAFSRLAPESLTVVAVGEGVPSWGLAAVRAVPVEPGRGRWIVEGEVIALPPPPESITLELRYQRDGLEGELPWSQRSLRVRDERTPFSFETSIPTAGILSLHLPADALAADNTARIALMAEPVPLRVAVIGPVPEAVMRALDNLVASQVTAVDDAVDGIGPDRFDLAIVAGVVGLVERPAATVLWLGGAVPDGPVAERFELGGSVTLGDGSLPGFSPVTDMPPGTPSSVFRTPRLPGATVLLDGPSGPLLQVRRDGAITDVVAAWDLGATEWVQELGFAVFFTELARNAQERYGNWTLPRCIAGRVCSASTSGLADGELGLQEGESGRWVVDGEAGPESDLRATAAAPPVPRLAPLPNRWTDRALLGLAAALMGVEAKRSFRRCLPRASRGRQDQRRLVVPALLCAASLALLLPVLGVPFPVPGGNVRTVVVIDPNAWPEAGTEAEDRWASSVASLPAETRAIVLAEGTGRLAADFGEPWETASLARQRRGYEPEAVIELALALLDQPGGRLVLMGVGFSAPGLAATTVDSLRARGVSVDVVPAPVRPADVWLTDELLPRKLRANEEVSLEFELVGDEAVNRTVIVTLDGERVDTTRVSGTRIRAAVNSGLPGTRTLTASVSPADVGLGLANDVLTTLLEVTPAGRVALVVLEQGSQRALVELLVDRGFDVVVWTPDDVPLLVDDLLGLDVVALLDVPAIDLHPLKQAALESWVREHGGGVLIAGAEGAFGPGGYLHTPLETLSALSARVPGDQAKAALAFVLDRSGSMQQTVAGTSRLDVAKAATLAAIDLLHPESQVSVVVFDDVATTLVPLGPPTQVGEALAPLGPGGGTNLYAALEAALDELRGSDAQARHMVVMTDGLAQPSNFDPLISRIVEAEITVSTVAVGRGADIQLLQWIAQSGGGAFHASEDVSTLPSILSQEAMLLSGSPLQEETIVPVFAPARAAFVQGLPEGFRPVSSFVRTTAKPESIVHAWTPDGFPLLASWRHGVGRVISYAAPIVGERSLPWSATDFARSLIAKAFRWLVSPATNRGITLTTVREGDSLRVSALVVGPQGAAEGGALLNLTVAPPGGGLVGPVPLTQVGGGTYSARIPAFEPGIYRLEVQAVDLRTRASRSSTSGFFNVSFPAALTPDATRAKGPALLARASGGRLLLDGNVGTASRAEGFSATQSEAHWGLVAILMAVLALGFEGAGGRRQGGAATVRRSRPVRAPSPT